MRVRRVCTLLAGLVAALVASTTYVAYTTSPARSASVVAVTPDANPPFISHDFSRVELRYCHYNDCALGEADLAMEVDIWWQYDPNCGRYHARRLRAASKVVAAYRVDWARVGQVRARMGATLVGTTEEDATAGPGATAYSFYPFAANLATNPTGAYWLRVNYDGVHGAPWTVGVDLRIAWADGTISALISPHSNPTASAYDLDWSSVPA